MEGSKLGHTIRTKAVRTHNTHTKVHHRQIVFSSESAILGEIDKAKYVVEGTIICEASGSSDDCARASSRAWPCTGGWEGPGGNARRPLQLGQIARSGDGEQEQEDPDYEKDKVYHGFVWVPCDAGDGGRQDPGGPPDREADGCGAEAVVWEPGKAATATATSRSAVVVRDGSVEGSIVVASGGHGAGGTRTEWIEHPPTCS